LYLYVRQVSPLSLDRWQTSRYPQYFALNGERKFRVCQPCDPSSRFNTNPTLARSSLSCVKTGLTDVTWDIQPLRPVRIQPVSVSQPRISRGSHTPPPCAAELGPVRVLRASWRQCSERLGVLGRYRPPVSSLNSRYCVYVGARQRRDLPQPKSNALPNPSAIMQN
jgi:hypothetical protein